MQVMDVNSATHFGSKRAPYLIIGFFLFATESRPDLGPFSLLTNVNCGGWKLFPPDVKRPEREADHSASSSAEVKILWAFISTPQYVFMAWCLIKHTDNFSFILSGVCT